jgi:hypothetical protein
VRLAGRLTLVGAVRVGSAFIALLAAVAVRLQAAAGTANAAAYADSRPADARAVAGPGTHVGADAANTGLLAACSHRAAGATTSAASTTGIAHTGSASSRAGDARRIGMIGTHIGIPAWIVAALVSTCRH